MFLQLLMLSVYLSIHGFIALGLPIPEAAFTPNYADFDVYEYLKDYEYNCADSPYIQQPMPFFYDGIEMTPQERRERRAQREKEIEHLLERMGIDVFA